MTTQLFILVSNNVIIWLWMCLASPVSYIVSSTDCEVQSTIWRKKMILTIDVNVTKGVHRRRSRSFFCRKGINLYRANNGAGIRSIFLNVGVERTSLGWNESRGWKKGAVERGVYEGGKVLVSRVTRFPRTTSVIFDNTLNRDRIFPFHVFLACVLCDLISIGYRVVPRQPVLSIERALRTLLQLLVAPPLPPHVLLYRSRVNVTTRVDPARFLTSFTRGGRVRAFSIVTTFLSTWFLSQYALRQNSRPTAMLHFKLYVTRIGEKRLTYRFVCADC